MTESGSDRPAHDPSDLRGGGGTGGGPGPDAQDLWEKGAARKRAEREGSAEPGDTSEPGAEDDE